MASDESKPNHDLVGIVKWIVLGVIAMTVLFLFKGEIGRLLERTENVEISPSGLKIRTTQTLLGKAEVSNVTLKESEVHGEKIQAGRYVNRLSRFQISWPDRDGWNASETMGASLMRQLGLPPTVNIPLVIMRDDMVGNFRPNVNVVVETIGTMSTAEYVDKSIELLQQQGWQLLTKDVDEATHGGFISFYNNMLGFKLYQFQRIAVAHGKAYIVTASQLPPEDSLSQQLREELLSILNSFRVIE